MQGHISRCGDELPVPRSTRRPTSLLIRTQMVGAASLGTNVAKRRGMARRARSRPQAGRHPAPHLERRLQFRWGKPAATPAAGR